MSLFKPSVKARNPPEWLTQYLFSGTFRIAKSPYLLNWYMSSAIDLYAATAIVSGLESEF